MLLIRRFKIQTHERGLLFRDGVAEAVLEPGVHWMFDPLRRVRVETVSVREVAFRHADLAVFHRRGLLKGSALVLDLVDSQRALIWVDGRFHGILRPGLHAFWTVFHEVRSEVVEVGDGRFEHPQLTTILNAPGSAKVLESAQVEAGTAALLYRQGRFLERLEPGRYALWRDAGLLRVLHVDLRAQTADVAGQEIMTADKVTLRLNAAVTYRVEDPRRFAEASNDGHQGLYRETQLALRSIVGTRTLDQLLDDREALAGEVEEVLRPKITSLGLELVAFGIRDLILPGEMRVLMNRVTEARKAAEANLIARREETAAMRSQANTARIFESNPMLMKLRELEVLEKVADRANLSVVLGETGLSERVLKMI
ncbi:MAG: slipin family protein [Acidobacteriota bacterium]|nr:slipin family protein [Acidobacteriota bacterium]